MMEILKSTAPFWKKETLAQASVGWNETHPAETWTRAL